MIERTPPYSADAEKAVLGAILLDNQSIENVVDLISCDDFYFEAHRRIYKEIISKYKTTPMDILTITSSMEPEKLKQIGGISFVAELVDNVPSAANIGYYGQIIKNHSLRRGLLKSAYEITEMAHDICNNINETIETSQKLILLINPYSNAASAKPAREVARSTMKEIEERHAKGGLSGISTGLRDVDQATAGLHPGELTILAGRPGMGKSALAINIGHSLGMAGEPVLINSVEMPNETLMVRILSSMTRIESSRIRSGYLGSSDWPKLVNSISQIANYPIYFDDSPIITPAEIRSRARKAKKEWGIKLLIVDYLQIITPGAKGERRDREISEISSSLRAIARELKIPVIAVCQLSREVEKRPNKRPMLSDLRESGSLEQDADIVLFIYRDEMYNKDEDNPEKGIAEIIIGKNRHGATPTIKACFSDKYQQFSDLAKTETQTPPWYKNE